MRGVIGRYVFRQLQKHVSMRAKVTSCGKLFQSLLPPTGQARSAIVTSHGGRTVSRADNDKCRQHVGDLCNYIMFGFNILLNIYTQSV